MTNPPVLYLLVGLPGVGKTTEALRLAERRRAIRFTPDEWMLPLFGESDPNGLRDVLEGRLVWVALQALRAGASAVIDFGLWARDERTALRALAADAGARAEVRFLDLDESERRSRIDARFADDPDGTFAMSPAEIDDHAGVFQRPTPDEIDVGPLDPVPPGYADWGRWAEDRWPSLVISR